jgi:energy-coupling factor transport system permease protein
MTLAESMDARGHGRGRRSRYRPDRWTSPATATIAVSVAALGAFGFATLAGWGDLLVSTSPLRWPEASMILVLAAFLFAVPAFLAPDTEERGR